jgi:hypothetical protein
MTELSSDLTSYVCSSARQDDAKDGVIVHSSEITLGLNSLPDSADCQALVRFTLFWSK